MQSYFGRIGRSSLHVLKYLICIASFIFLVFIKAFFCAYYLLCGNQDIFFIYDQPNFSLGEVIGLSKKKKDDVYAT